MASTTQPPSANLSGQHPVLRSSSTLLQSPLRQMQPVLAPASRLTGATGTPRDAHDGVLPRPPLKKIKRCHFRDQSILCSIKLNQWVNNAPTQAERIIRSIIERAIISHTQINESGDLVIEGDLDLSEYKNLTALPDPLTVNGDLTVSGCENLANLPYRLTVHGDLNAPGCIGLTSLYDNHLVIDGSLDLSDCKNITALPPSLKGIADLSVSNCTLLRTLPNGLHVEGSFYAPHCINLTTVPEGLNVKGDCDFSHCRVLSNLPNRFTVGETLCLSNCNSLRTLPEALTVANLGLYGCGVTALPNDLTVGNTLALSNRAVISALPAWIESYSAREGSEQLIINIDNPQLSEATIEGLYRINTLRAYILINGDPLHYQKYENLELAIKSWIPDTSIKFNDWGMSAAEQEHLLNFLSRLHDTAEAQNKAIKPTLIGRVSAFLTQLHENKNEYRSQALERISEGLESCDDRVILILNNIEVLTHIREASSSSKPEQALRELGKSLLALEIVHQHAAKKCANSPTADEVEVYLVFEIKLAKTVNLPVATQSMYFPRLAEISSDNIEAAKEAALSAINNPEKVEEYLQNWEPWQKLQRAEAIKNLSWEKLPQSSHFFASEASCLISSVELDDIDRPISVGNNLYSLSSFTQWWAEHGTDPATREKVGIDTIHKVDNQSDKYDSNATST